MSNVSRLPGPSADVWDWQRNGACRGRDSAQFFHPDGERGASRLRREIAAKAVCRSARSGPNAPHMPSPPGSPTESGAASPRPSGYDCSPPAGRTSPTGYGAGSTCGRLEARLGLRTRTRAAPRPGTRPSLDRVGQRADGRPRRVSSP